MARSPSSPTSASEPLSGVGASRQMRPGRTRTPTGHAARCCHTREASLCVLDTQNANPGHTAGYNGHMTDLALLAQEVGVSERTLRRAANQGSLRARRPTPRTLDLPLSERQYVRRSWRLLAALRRALRTEPNVRFALLFGSAAEGTDVASSDLDVVVALGDPGIERLVELSERLTAAVGRSVDVVRLSDAEEDPAFLAEVLESGRVLVDRDQLWPRLRSRRATLRRRVRDREAHRVDAALAGIDRLLAR
jgi:predicted nucleotidyltransferase